MLLFRYWSVRGKSTPAAGPVDLLAIQAGEGQIGPGAGRILRSNCEECPGPHPNRKWQAETEVNRAVSRLQHQKTVGRVQVRRAGFGRDETPDLWWKATKKQCKAMVIKEISRAPGEVNHVGGRHQLINQLGRPMEDVTVEDQFLAEGNLRHLAMPQKPPTVVQQGGDLLPLQCSQCQLANSLSGCKRALTQSDSPVRPLKHP